MPVLVVALVAVLVTAGCGLEPAGVLPFERAALVVDDGATPPDDADPRWRGVALPDHWGAARRVAGLAGWYRLVVDLPARPETLWAIGLPLVVQNAAVRVNGERVGNGGPFAPTMARNWNRPLFVTVPPGVLHAGRNVVHVRLASEGVAPPILGRVYVGPAAAIEPPLVRRAALQVGVARATTVVGVVLLGLLALLLRHREYFVGGWWFLVALALLTASSADGFVHVPPVSTPVWDWLVTMLRLAAAASLLLGVHRHLDLVRARVEGVVWLVVAAYGAVLAAVPPSWALPATLGAYGIGVLLGLWALGLLVRHRRRTPARVAIGFLAVGLACLLFALHDLAGVLGFRLLPLLLVPYAFTLVVVVEAGVVVGRLVRGWGDLVALNRELEARVAAKHAELEETWERVRGLERERVVAEERRRITRVPRDHPADAGARDGIVFHQHDGPEGGLGDHARPVPSPGARGPSSSIRTRRSAARSTIRRKRAASARAPSGADSCLHGNGAAAASCARERAPRFVRAGAADHRRGRGTDGARAVGEEANDVDIVPVRPRDPTGPGSRRARRRAPGRGGGRAADIPAQLRALSQRRAERRAVAPGHRGTQGGDAPGLPVLEGVARERHRVDAAGADGVAQGSPRCRSGGGDAVRRPFERRRAYGRRRVPEDAVIRRPRPPIEGADAAVSPPSRSPPPSDAGSPSPPAVPPRARTTRRRWRATDRTAGRRRGRSRARSRG